MSECISNEVCLAASPSPSASPSSSVSPSPSGSAGGYCGNGVVDAGERCDKQNNAGCSAGQSCNFDCSACFIPGEPSGSILRIEGKKVVGAELIESANVSILYNSAGTGLSVSCSEAAKAGLYFTVDDLALGSIPSSVSCNPAQPGVFILNLTPQLLGLQSPELASGSYRVRVDVIDNGKAYSANDPQALIVVKQKKALPESDLLVIAFFALLAFFFVRRKEGR